MKEEKRGREEVEDWKEGKGGRRDRNRRKRRVERECQMKKEGNGKVLLNSHIYTISIVC